MKRSARFGERQYPAAVTSRILAPAVLAVVLSVAGCSSSPAAPVAQASTPPAATTAAASSAAPTPTAVATSAKPAPASTKAAPVDNPAFDMTGSGSDCTMTYGPSQSGGTLTTVTVTTPGEIITHVSDASGTIHRNDTHLTQGPNAFTYDVPLSQVGDMGAVFYPDDGQSESCTIKAAQ